MSTASSTPTPLIAQYFEIKSQYPDAILFFQVGDFYELFFDDAKTAASVLVIALTKRGKLDGQDIPLCGVPLQSLNHHLNKLVKSGYKVAICDQMSKPVPGQVVKRAVTGVLTPGTLVDETLLDARSPSYLMSFYKDAHNWGLVFAEVLTAQTFVTTIPVDQYRMLESELARFFPDEIVLDASQKDLDFNEYFCKQGYVTSFADNSDQAGQAYSTAWIEQKFSDSVRAQLALHPSAEGALRSLCAYLRRNNEAALSQVGSLTFYQPHDYLILDASTQRNLEIVRNSQDGGRKNTLVSVLDKSCTPMGSRAIKKWLLRPLVDKRMIMQRQDVVTQLVGSIGVMQKLKELLQGLSDLERIAGRIALGRGLFCDYTALKRTLALMPEMVTFLQHKIGAIGSIPHIANRLYINNELVGMLERSLDESGEYTIKSGFDVQLDQVRSLVNHGHDKILEFEAQEIQATGIGSLKVRYTDVFGYSIEITAANYQAVPPHYVQQQTLSGRCRYITPQLKELEHALVQAKTKITSLEDALYQQIKAQVMPHVSAIRQTAHALATLDGLYGFACAAYEYGYTAPQLSDNRDILISGGRHPVVEQVAGKFIPNDTRLDDSQSIWIVTGPNMGGKSTYLRQVAIVALMAQCGSHVPAKSATLPILDRIFTRIGSGDDVAGGRSTFMVEMEEAAMICNEATAESLVILDEVGRGTSTDDGMALAQAIVEYLATAVCSRALFATHYHELTALTQTFSFLANYHMAFRPSSTGMTFLYTMVPGAASGSFGLDVARKAGMPSCIVDRAHQILQVAAPRQENLTSLIPPRQAQGERILGKADETEKSDSSDKLIISGLQQEVARLRAANQKTQKMLEILEILDPDDISPRRALDILWQLMK